MIPSLLHDLRTSEKLPTEISLSGKPRLTLPEVIAVSYRGAKVRFALSPKAKRIGRTVISQMLAQIKEGVAIYGATTAYGGQASRLFTEGNETSRYKQAVELSKAIIHVDVSTGNPVPKEITRAAMLLRINMLLPGYSAIRSSTLDLLRRLLNAGITPIVGSLGSVGASGDLAQNGRVLATLLQLPETFVLDKRGKLQTARSALSRIGLAPLRLEPKEGLALVNGDNFSTAAAACIGYELALLFLFNLLTSTLAIQALRGSIRDFHPMLSSIRPHPGQQFVASLLRYLLQGSRLAYQDLISPTLRDAGDSVQDPYSIRCLPQYYGPDWERLLNAWQTIFINANSVSDNPLWTTPEFTTPGEEPYQWVSGGNFLAMHMAETLDDLRKIAVHIVKQNDRHLARLVHPTFNNGLPANLSHSSAISQCTFKGLQTQLGMYDVYATLLSVPVSTAFGSHEEFNQDVTSHAMTSAILTLDVLRLVRYSLATMLIANCQAVDLRGGEHLLSPQTRFLYAWVRQSTPFIKKEQPMGNLVERLASDMNETLLLRFVSRIPYEDSEHW